MKHDPTFPPNPGGGWSMACKGVAGAVVVPPQTADFIQECGVLDAQGGYCPRGATWRREQAITVAPGRSGPVVAEVPGRWLWGGVLYNHFGHFQVESTARLWAVPGLRGALDGVLFAAKSPDEPLELRPYQAEYLRLMIGDLAVKITRDITRVEHLEVPGQGFGLGEIGFGTRVYRRFVHENFARDIKPEGPQDLFISRSAQGPGKGGFVGEAILDDRMARAGYEVFHPEAHDIATQVARYRAARRVVAFDGSALHLYAMVAGAEQKAAVILRRKRGASRSLRRHMERFTGVAPLVIDVLRAGSWDDPKHGKKGLMANLDLVRMGRELAEGGFIAPEAAWGPLSGEEEQWIAGELAALGAD